MSARPAGGCGSRVPLPSNERRGTGPLHRLGLTPLDSRLGYLLKHAQAAPARTSAEAPAPH
jgi:hypothetical protein